MMKNENEISYDNMIKLMLKGSGRTDYYLGKIDNKNIILALRDTHEITNDDPSVLDSRGIESVRYLKDHEIIGDKEESITVTLIKEAYHSVSKVTGSGSRLIYLGSIAHILYISNKENIKKSIDKKYILNILKDEEISCLNMITYVNDEYHIFRKDDGGYNISNIHKTFLKRLKDSEEVILSHYTFK